MSHEGVILETPTKQYLTCIKNEMEWLLKQSMSWAKLKRKGWGIKNVAGLNQCWVKPLLEKLYTWQSLFQHPNFIVFQNYCGCQDNCDKFICEISFLMYFCLDSKVSDKKIKCEQYINIAGLNLIKDKTNHVTCDYSVKGKVTIHWYVGN